MKKILFAIFAAAALFAGCSKEGGSDSPLTADFTVSANPCFAGDPIKLTAKVSGGKSPYTYEWTIQETTKTEAEILHTFKTNGTVRVKLAVKDSDGKSAEKTKLVVVNPAQVAETGEVTLNWVGYMEGYGNIAAPAVADDGSVYAVSDADKVYKFTSTGSKAWEKVVVSDPENKNRLQSTPSIDSDGTVYVAGGTQNGTAVIKAYNPDGSEKWSFTDFWNKGNAHQASITGGIVGIGDANVYMGNTGQTGTIIAIGKADGKRKGYVTDGSAGPAGGARSGIVISKGGYLHWYGGMYGLFAAKQSGVDSGTNGYAKEWRQFTDALPSASHSSLGCMVVNGKNCVIGIVTDNVSTKVYAVNAEDGEVVSLVRINDTASQDQGGVVTTTEGYIVASLNYELGKANGGVIFVDPATSTVKARYSTQEKVSGSAAVDKAGNVHFFTESGYYYVVKPDYTTGNCELKVKRDMASIISADSRYEEAYAELYQAKFWSSPVIGDDGKIYIHFTDEETRAFGGVLCVSFSECEGPADSDWPMIGQNRRHTNRQK